MAEDTSKIKPDAVDAALGDMKLEEDHSSSDTLGANGNRETESPPVEAMVSPSPNPKDSTARSLDELAPTSEDERKQLRGSEITQKVEQPKLSRKSSQKVFLHPPKLYDNLPDSTSEAITKFQVIRDCIYGSKYMGSSEHDALGCDCSEEWRDGKNHACGEDSDCINRATKMECIDYECNCGSGCKNQRFQRKQFAQVSVIRTEKKGYGLRADSDLRAHDFIFEYIGEVINEPTFRRRTIQYDEEGIRHFYFMSLTKNEFVDATKKGNLGRFCNHSCSPNCYVDKWVVGNKLRMGIFAERNIKAGEELVFNYNVDRYGADPQPCYCGEPCCAGFIGGKTQTERATKLSHDTIEALGIDDGDGWDTTLAKKPRKKRVGEDDEEYVNSLQPRNLDEQGVRKVMATLMQCKEKWIAVKLLSRIQRCDDDRVRNCVVQMHGYQILRTTLNMWIEDNNAILQILDILYKFPRLTRNKIVDSKIETTIEDLTKYEHEDVAFEAKRLLEEWSKLELAYRIPRRKPEPPSTESTRLFLRREDRADEVPKTVIATSTVVAPTGPRNSMPQRNSNFYPLSRSIGMRRPFNQLPPGWFAALDGLGNTYYYSKSGQTTWQRPYLPAVEPPPPPKAPPKSVQNQKALQDIIDSLTKPDTNSQTPKPGTPQPTESVAKDRQKGAEKWRSYPQEKQMKVYENTLFPPIKYVMDKFRHKLPKDDLKKFAKEIAKKLVASDFKHNRVEDPTKITPNQEKKVKKHVKEFFDKAVAKKAEHDRRKAEKQQKADAGTHNAKCVMVNDGPDTGLDSETPVKADESDDMDMSDEEENEQAVPSGPTTPVLDTPSDEGLKRKREDLAESFDSTPSETPSKRFKDEDVEAAPSPPPPPPPPPAEDLQMQIDEEAELAAQEEALIRENEEALMLENEAAIKIAALRKEMTISSVPLPDSKGDVDVVVNGLQKEVNGNVIMKLEAGALDSEHVVKDVPGTNGVDEKRDIIQHERKQVLSH